jgi:hypothetical protein
VHQACGTRPTSGPPNHQTLSRSSSRVSSMESRRKSSRGSRLFSGENDDTVAIWSGSNEK